LAVTLPDVSHTTERKMLAVSGRRLDVRENVPAVSDHRHKGDGTMQPAQAFFPKATTFLTHLVRLGLADKRYVVQRFRSMLDGDIRLVDVEAPKG